ncbi:DUF397 domain-containing protein [Pseudonocardia acaciae]|uniref:DUF397 domain-containing protein n=1 Tax=Pseudonocardia acaciae TaxID=551276 RepID=UPI0005661507|nr:DUF397 domain-containing protein [Pseudonocardia acaciae]
MPQDAWRTSSYTRDTELCVEVAPTAGGALIRHSRRPDAGTISFSSGEWLRFIRDARSNRPSTNGAAEIELADDGAARVRSLRDGLELHFTDGEWRAFVSGIRAGEFDFHRPGHEPSARNAG